MNNLVTTFDFGSTGIRCVTGNIENKNIKILAKAETEIAFYKKGVYSDNEALFNSLKTLNNIIKEGAGSSIESAFINISGQYVNMIKDDADIDIIKESTLIEYDDVENIHSLFKKRHESADWIIIDIICQNFTIEDYDGIPDPIGMLGNNLKENATIILIQREFLKNIVAMMKNIGIGVEGLIFSPLAVSEIVLSTEDKKKRVGIIDCGGKQTEIYIFENKKLLYYYAFGLGGDNITKDVACGQKISEIEAEKLKKSQNFIIKVPKDVSVHGYIDIIEARIIEILEIIKEKFINQDIYKDVENIIITGQGISHYKGLDVVAEIILEKKIRVALGNDLGIINSDYLNAIGMLKYIMNEFYDEKNNGEDDVEKVKKVKKQEKIFYKKILAKLGKK